MKKQKTQEPELLQEILGFGSIFGLHFLQSIFGADGEPYDPEFEQFLKDQDELEPIRGLYFWGGVGRGKTFVMDLFYEGLPFEDKLRLHFHRFMRRVHKELTGLQGTPDPLQTIAQRFADEARVLCFDEFFVSDITDAMIMANLLDALFL